MKKQAWLVVLYLIALSACSAPTIESKICEQGNASVPGSAGCLVEVTDLTGFDWDRMFVVTDGASPELVERTLGTNLPEPSGYTRRLVFMKGAQIVFQEQHAEDVESPLQDSVVWPIRSGELIATYTRSEATFWVQRRTFGSVSYYVLSQVVTEGAP